MAISRRKDSRIGIGDVMVLSRNSASTMQQTIIDNIRNEIDDRLKIDYFQFSNISQWTDDNDYVYDKSKIDKPMTWQDVENMVHEMLTDDNASSFIKDIVSVFGYQFVYQLTIGQLKLESQLLKQFDFNYGNETEQIGELFSQVRTEILETEIDDRVNERKQKEVERETKIQNDLETIASEKWINRKGNATIFQDLTSITLHNGFNKYQPTNKQKGEIVQSRIDDNLDAYFDAVKKVVLVLNSSDKVNSFVRNAKDDVVIKLSKRFSIPENLAVDLWILMQSPNKSTE